MATIAPTNRPATNVLYFSWNLVPGAAHYGLYWGDGHLRYTNVLMTTGTSAIVSNLASRYYHYASATTFDALGRESQYSVEVNTMPKTNRHVWGYMQTSTNLSRWDDVPNSTFINLTNPVGPNRFYKLRLEEELF